MTGGKSPAGGLGKAKEMLFHAWPEWEVWTQSEHEPRYYVKARYGPYMKGNLLESKKLPKTKTGTTISVTMKKDRCINKEDLYSFIELSSFPISVIWRKFEDDQLVEENKLQAKNKITEDEPIRVLTRSDGSPWADIYHMPRARNFRQVVIRASGLYLFSAPGSYDIKGKVIIELKYKPKNKKWDSDNENWVPMDANESAKQSIEDYGPLELLTESRDGLLNAYIGGSSRYYQHRLNSFLESLIKRPDTALKRKRPKKRIRAVNRIQESINFDEIFEVLKPKTIIDSPEKAIEKMQELSEVDLLHRFLKAVRHGDVVISDSQTFKETFNDGQIEMLKRLMKDPDIKDKLSKINEQQKVPQTVEEILEEGEEEGVETSQIDEIVEEVEGTLEEVKYTSISTGVDLKLYKLYAEILKPVMKAARESGKGTNYAENVIKMLRWEPDIILSDETEAPTKSSPAKYDPMQFGPKEKQVAKLWVEVIRLIHMIKGIANLELDVGFLFENPDSDAFDGEYVEGESEDIGSFKAVLVAPAKLGKSNNWKHRYKIRNYDSIAEFTALAFHEVVHSTLALMDVATDVDHAGDFANIISGDLAIVMRYGSGFFKLAKYCADAYPIIVRGESRTARPKAIQVGEGFYAVKCEGRRGRPPKLRTLAEARAFSRMYVSEHTYSNCDIIPYYKAEARKDREVYDWDKVYSYKEPTFTEEERIEKIRDVWDEYRDSDDPYGKDIFFRQRKRLKRRKK